MNGLELPTIHYSKLTAMIPGTPLAEEWETYRHEVHRLLSEGNEGRHVLIKGNEIIGIWDTFREANDEGCKRFPNEQFLAKEILTEEPFLRIGYNKLCRS